MKAITAIGLILIFFVILCSGCGYKAGTFSLPYPEDTEPQKQKVNRVFLISELQQFEMPDYSLTVNLRNQRQTSDTGWLLFIPIHLKLSNIWRHELDGPDSCCIQLSMTSNIEGMSFDPQPVKLTVEGTAHPMDSMKLLKNAREWEFVEEGTAIDLTVNTAKTIQLCFRVPRPKPKQDIQLDLRDCIRHPDGQPGPVIHFKKTKYRYPYS